MLTELLKVPSLGIENMNWTTSVNRAIKVLGALDSAWPKSWRFRDDQVGFW